MTPTLKVNLRSTNAKTGPIPVTSRTGGTCPSDCPFVRPDTLEPGKECYGNGRIAWWAKQSGVDEDETLAVVRTEAPPNALVRHHEVGDITLGDQLDRRYLAALAALADARPDLRHIMYTHAWRHGPKDALGLPWVVNASCETPQDVQDATDAGYQAVMVFPTVDDVPDDVAGRRVVRCPAEVKPGDITCKTCGLCAKDDTPKVSRAVVAFVAHGSGKRSTAMAIRRRNGKDG